MSNIQITVIWIKWIQKEKINKVQIPIPEDTKHTLAAKYCFKIF